MTRRDGANQRQDCAARKGNGQLVKFIKNPRRDHAHKDAAECAANRDHQVKTGKVLRLRLEACQLSVANHAANEQADAKKRNLQPGTRIDEFRRQRIAHSGERNGQEPHK